VPWVLRRRASCAAFGEYCLRTVRAYWLARDRGTFVPQSDLGVTGLDASSAPCVRRGVVLLRSRVHLSPSPVGRPLSNAVRDGGGPLSPAPSTCRPSPSRRPGQVGWGVSPAVSLASLRRSLAAPCRPEGCRPSDHPASAFGATAVAPKPLRSRRPCGFRASRLRCSVLLPCSYCATSLGRGGGGAARAGHSCLAFFEQRTYRARARASSRGLAGRRFPVGRRRPWDLLIALRSFDPTPRVSAPLRPCSDPPAVSPRGPPRVPSIAGPGCYAGS
jgi:hypothetical protein